MEEGAEAQRRAAAHLVGERLGEQRPGVGGALAGEALQVGLDLERALEHGERVAEHVEVVIRALFDAAQRLDLGQDDRGQLQLVEQSEAAQRVGPAEQPAQLGELPLPRRIGGERGLRAGERGGLGVDLEAQVGGEADGAQQPQGVFAEGLDADRAQPPPLEVGDAAEGVDRLAAGERHGHRAEGEVARRQVGRDRLAAQRGGVDLPGAVAGDRAPGGELGRELEGEAVLGVGDRLGDTLGVAADRQVEVGHLAPQRRVAHGPAGDPDVGLARQRPPGEPDEGRRVEALGEAHPATLGTRAEMPQVIS